jgi:hypothetical protein
MSSEMLINSKQLHNFMNKLQEIDNLSEKEIQEEQQAKELAKEKVLQLAK